MLDPGANYDTPRYPQTADDYKKLYEQVISRWMSHNDSAFTVEGVELHEQVHRLRLLFVELVAAFPESRATFIFGKVAALLESLRVYTEVLGANPDGSEGKLEREIRYGKIVTNWIRGIENTAGVVGNSKEELMRINGLMCMLGCEIRTQFTNRLFERLANTAYEAQHLLTQHRLLIDEPHMFSAYNPGDTALIVNPAWVDWLVKRMANQSPKMVSDTITTSVMHELRTSVLSPELLEAYDVKVEADPHVMPCRVILTRKDSGLQDAINRYMKG